MKQLKIRDEFLTGEDKASLTRYILTWSKQSAKLANKDIHSILVKSPYEIYSIAFHKYFFESILGKNKVLQKYKKFFSDEHRWQNTYVYKQTNTFLDKFTNITEIEAEIYEFFQKNLATPLLIIENDEFGKIAYLVYMRLKNNKSLYLQMKQKEVYFIDWTRLIIKDKRRDGKLWRILGNSPYKKGFHTNLDLQEMQKHYSALIIS